MDDSVYGLCAMTMQPLVSVFVYIIAVRHLPEPVYRTLHVIPFNPVVLGRLSAILVKTAAGQVISTCSLQLREASPLEVLFVGQSEKI